MTVSSSTNRWPFSGNDVTTEFSIGKVFAAADVTVYLLDSDGEPTTQTINTHYSVSLLGTSAAKVTMVTAPPTGYTLLVVRNQPLTQGTDLKNQGAFLPEIHEDALDKLFMMIARMWHRLTRSVSQSDTSVDDLDLTLPDPSAGQAIGWNDAGDGLANIGDFTGTALPLSVVNGGTGGSTASAARANLGLIIGTNVQAYDAELAAIAGLVSAADKLAYFTGSGAAALAPFTAGGRALVNSAGTANTFPYFSSANTVTLATITAAGLALLDDANGTAQLATMGFTIATQANQETGTDLTAIVTSGRQHYHPSAAKVQGDINLDGTVDGSYNISSITDVATGRMGVNFTVSFSSAEYTPNVSLRSALPADATAAQRKAHMDNGGTVSASRCDFFCHDNQATPAYKDPTEWFVVIYGDQ
jgi:hypothetical protein